MKSMNEDIIMKKSIIITLVLCFCYACANSADKQTFIDKRFKKDIGVKKNYILYYKGRAENEDACVREVEEHIIGYDIGEYKINSVDRRPVFLGINESGGYRYTDSTKFQVGYRNIKSGGVTVEIRVLVEEVAQRLLKHTLYSGFMMIKKEEENPAKIKKVVKNIDNNIVVMLLPEPVEKGSAYHIGWISGNDKSVMMEVRSPGSGNRTLAEYKIPDEVINAYLKKYPSSLKPEDTTKTLEQITKTEVEESINMLKYKDDADVLMRFYALTFFLSAIDQEISYSERLKLILAWWETHKDKPVQVWIDDAIEERIKLLKDIEEMRLTLDEVVRIKVELPMIARIDLLSKEIKKGLPSLSEVWQKWWQENKAKPPEERIKWTVQMYLDLMDADKVDGETMDLYQGYLAAIGRIFSKAGWKEGLIFNNYKRSEIDGLKKLIKAWKEWWPKNKDNLTIKKYTDDPLGD